MYKLVNQDTGETVGITESPTYIRLSQNGCFVLCKAGETPQGVAFASQPYNLFGKEPMSPGLPTVIVTEVDGGQELQAMQQQVHTAQTTADGVSAMSTQLRTAARLYVQKAVDIPDNTALEMPDLFRTWDEVLAAGAQLEANTILNDSGQLYRVVQAVTPQAHQAPHDEGMLAIYRPIDKQHVGTLEDPIPFVNGMDTEKDKYYSYNGKTYLCNLAMAPCVWAPDTAGLWQWTEVS